MQNSIYFGRISSLPRVAKAKAKEDFTEANKQVKKHTRVDKCKYFYSLVEAGAAAAANNMKQLYNTTKKPSGV